MATSNDPRANSPATDSQAGGLGHTSHWRGAIVGQGAIGLLAASQLALAGQPLPLLLRPPASTQTIALTFSRGQQDAALMLSSQIRPPLDLLLLPVKAFAVLPALQQYLPLLQNDADIVLSHNGMGTLTDANALLLPTQKLWFASTTHGALKTAPNRLRHTGLGQTSWGPVNQAAALAVQQNTAASLGQLMNTALGPATLCQDIQPVLWRKLAINALINPLTALHQSKNGALADARFAPQLAQLLSEFIQVASACGVPFAPAELAATVQQVIAATAENYSSMQQDFMLQRPDELDFITGYLLRRASEHQLTLPAHQQLYQQLCLRRAG